MVYVPWTSNPWMLFSASSCKEELKMFLNQLDLTQIGWLMPLKVDTSYQKSICKTLILYSTTCYERGLKMLKCWKWNCGRGLCMNFITLNYLEIFIISVSSEDVYRLASLIFETQESGVIEKFGNFKYLLSQSHCTIGNSRKSNVLHQCNKLEVLVPLSTYSPEA